MSDFFNTSGSTANVDKTQGQTIGTFVASLGGAAAAFAVQVLVDTSVCLASLGDIMMISVSVPKVES